MEKPRARLRSVSVIGILSIVFGSIQVLGIPLVIFVSNVVEPYLRSVSPAAPSGSDFEFLGILLGVIHWFEVDPNIMAAVAILSDIPLGIILIRSGIRTLKGEPAGRRLALLYVGIVLAMEGLNVILVALNWEEWIRSLERSPLSAAPIDLVWAGFSLARKVTFPIVLLIFFTQPRVRALFLPE